MFRAHVPTFITQMICYIVILNQQNDMHPEKANEIYILGVSHELVENEAKGISKRTFQMILGMNIILSISLGLNIRHIFIRIKSLIDGVR